MPGCGRKSFQVPKLLIAHLQARSAKRLGALRFWKPMSIIFVALGGGLIAESFGIDAIIWPLAILQFLAAGIAFLIPRLAVDPPMHLQAIEHWLRRGSF